MIIRYGRAALWRWWLLLLLLALSSSTLQPSSSSSSLLNNNENIQEIEVRKSTSAELLASVLRIRESRFVSAVANSPSRAGTATKPDSNPIRNNNQFVQADCKLLGASVQVCDVGQRLGFAVLPSHSRGSESLPSLALVAIFRGDTRQEVFVLPEEASRDEIKISCDRTTCSKLLLQQLASDDQPSNSINSSDNNSRIRGRRWWSVDFGQHWQQSADGNDNEEHVLSMLYEDSSINRQLDNRQELVFSNALPCPAGSIPFQLLQQQEVTCAPCGGDSSSSSATYQDRLCRHLASNNNNNLSEVDSYSDAEVISQTTMSIIALLWMMLFAIIYIFKGRFVEVTETRRLLVLQPLLICMESITNVLRSKVDAEEDLTELTHSPTQQVGMSCWKILTVLLLLFAVPIVVFCVVVCVYAVYLFFCLALVYQNYAKTSANHNVDYISRLMLETMLPLPELFGPLLTPTMHAMNSLANASLTFGSSSGMMDCVGVQYSLLLLIRLVILLNLVIFLCSRYPSLLGTAFVKFLKYFERWKLSSRQGYESYIVATSVYCLVGCLLLYSNILHLLLQYSMSMIAFYKHHEETMYSAAQCASLTSPQLHRLIVVMERVPVLIGFIFVQPLIYSASIILVPKLPSWMRIDVKSLRDTIYIAHHNQPHDPTKSRNLLLILFAKCYFRFQRNRYVRGAIYRGKVVATYFSVDLLLMEFFIRACRLVSNWMRLSATKHLSSAAAITIAQPTATSSTASASGKDVAKRESMMAAMMMMTASLGDEEEGRRATGDGDEETNLRAAPHLDGDRNGSSHVQLASTTWQNVISSFAATEASGAIQDESFLEDTPELIFMATTETIAAARDDVLPSYLELSQIVYQHFLLPPSAALTTEDQIFSVKSTVQHVLGVFVAMLFLPLVVLLAILYTMMSYCCCKNRLHAFRELEDDEEVAKLGFCRRVVMNASVWIFAVIAKFLRVVLFVLSYTIVGHLMTDFGRQSWKMVIWNYYIFCLTSIGIWTEDAVVAFAIKEDDILLDRASQCKLGLTIASVDQFESWGKTRRRYDAHRLWSTIASRALFFQLHASMTIVSIYVTNTAMIPIAVYTKEIVQQPWLAWDAYRDAMEREAESSYRWTAVVQAVQDFLHQSRLIQYSIHLCLTLIPVLYVFRGNRYSDADLHVGLGYVFILICLVWTAQYSATALHYIGKYLHITDADLGLAQCWKQLELKKVQPAPQEKEVAAVPSRPNGVILGSGKHHKKNKSKSNLVESFDKESSDSGGSDSDGAASSPRKEEDLRQPAKTSSPVLLLNRGESSRSSNKVQRNSLMLRIDEKIEDLEDLEDVEHELAL